MSQIMGYTAEDSVLSFGNVDPELLAALQPAANPDDNNTNALLRAIRDALLALNGEYIVPHADHNRKETLAAGATGITLDSGTDGVRMVVISVQSGTVAFYYTDTPTGIADHVVPAGTPVVIPHNGNPLKVTAYNVTDPAGVAVYSLRLLQGGGA